MNLAGRPQSGQAMLQPWYPLFPALKAGLVGGGGQVVGLVAEGEFQLAEELGVGAIDQGLRHPVRGPLDVGAELIQEGADSSFAVVGDGRRGRRRLRQHGCGPAVG